MTHARSFLWFAVGFWVGMFWLALFAGCGGKTEPKWELLGTVTICGEGEDGPFAFRFLEAERKHFGEREREELSNIAWEYGPGTTATLYVAQTTINVPWSFCGKDGNESIDVVLYGIRYQDIQGRGPRDEMRMGISPTKMISIWPPLSRNEEERL